MSIAQRYTFILYLLFVFGFVCWWDKERHKTISVKITQYTTEHQERMTKDLSQHRMWSTNKRQGEGEIKSSQRNNEGFCIRINRMKMLSNCYEQWTTKKYSTKYKNENKNCLYYECILECASVDLKFLIFIIQSKPELKIHKTYHYDSVVKITFGF